MSRWVLIDTAPLIASPERQGTTREAEVLHTLTNGDLYVCPVGGSPLYIRPHWVVKELGEQ